MMIKNFLFVAGLLSLALASGCAKGGSGPCVNNCPAVTVNDDQQIVVGLTLSIPLTATVTGTSQTAVNWSITGTSCSGSGNPCGTLTNVTTSSATYVAPSAVPSSPSITIVATLQSDSTVSGSQDLTIIPITTDVAPPTPSVGLGLTQQFTAVAVPDQAPQTFTWTCTAGGGNCQNFHQDPNVSGLAYYTATFHEQCGHGCVQISAVSTLDPTGSGCSYNPQKYPCTTGEATFVASRLSGNVAGAVPFAFRFSGYDSSGNQVLFAGSFTATGNAITSGVEDEISWNGTQYSFAQLPITGGLYTPTSSDPNNSNNAGILSLTLPSGAFPYQVVLDAAGDIQMIQSDANGSGSGIAESSSNKQFNGSNQTFAFGFTGVDSSGKRVGYAGLLTTDGVSNITGGTIDVNDDGNSINSVCNTGPCNVSGTYIPDGSISGLWHVTLTTPVLMTFDLFVANGSANANNPLTLYAISTNSAPYAMLGTMVLQDSTQTYNNAAFKGSSVSALTGANDNVSLTLGTADGTTDSSGNGGFTGQFDQNNGGVTEISVPATSPFAYKYAASGTSGRYTFQMLGNPNVKPAVPPLTFILYASGANRGFLLDQSSQAVITGTMYAQQSPKQNGGLFANSAMTGTYAVATNGSSLASPQPTTMNLLLTSPGKSVFSVGGTENGNPANAVTGTYAVQSPGTGTINLTKPSTADYIFYAVDGTHFYMIQDASKDAGVASPILFVAQ